MLSQPYKEPMPSAAPSLPPVHLHTFPHASSIHMIKYQKRILLLPAADAQTSVGLDGCFSKPEIPVPTLLVPVVTMRSSVQTYLLEPSSLRILLLGSLGALLASRRWLTLLQVEVHLWFGLAALATVLHMTKITKLEAWERALKVQRG